MKKITMNGGSVFQALVRIYSHLPRTEHITATVKFTPYRYRMHLHCATVTSSRVRVLHQPIDKRKKKGNT